MWTPLDCAAAKGHTKVAGVLLDFDSPVDPIDKAKVLAKQILLLYQLFLKNWFMLSLACVYRVMDAGGKFGERERNVRVARGDSREQL